MAKRNHRSQFNGSNKRARRTQEQTPTISLAERAAARKPPTKYGAPFIVLEDKEKQTFTFARGAWVPYEQSIEECKVDCMVKALPQQVNNMTRYEIRSPV